MSGIDDWLPGEDAGPAFGLDRNVSFFRPVARASWWLRVYVALKMAKNAFVEGMHS